MCVRQVPAGASPAIIRVLGPVDAVASGPLPIGGRLEKMLLAALAVSANHAVSADELSQILWGDDPPASQSNALQTYISRLRAVLGHDRITSEDHSYKLHVTRDDLDALLFESLLAEAVTVRADRSRCLALCKEALHLWRGAPFGDFADRDPFRLEAIRLDELRLFVIELQLECEIDLGHEELVVGSLEALVEEYPYRERIWHLFIAALALSGRRVDALRACNQLRAVLGEVGLEPTAEILQLEETIVTEDPNVRPRLTFVVERDNETMSPR